MRGAKATGVRGLRKGKGNIHPFHVPTVHRTKKSPCPKYDTCEIRIQFKIADSCCKTERGPNEQCMFFNKSPKDMLQ